MSVRRRFQVQILLLAVVFLSACLTSGFIVVNHTCADCADYSVVCHILADSRLSSWQPDSVAALGFFFLTAKALLLAAVGQFPENLHALSLVRWKIQMNN